MEVPLVKFNFAVGRWQGFQITELVIDSGSKGPLITQAAFTCSKLIETLEQGVKYVQT